MVPHFKNLCAIIFSCFSEKVVKATSIYTRQHVKLYLTIATKFLHKNCGRNFFVPMKVDINGKSNLCIPQTTIEVLFCYYSLVAEIFQEFRHTESCVRKYFVPMVYAINGRSNNYIPQTTRRLLYHCSWAVKILKQLRHIENCFRKLFVPVKVVINRKNKLCILRTTSKTLFCYY